ncbi:DUF6543 domain-containing protein [Pseudomonas sp. RIT-PI-S]|uniref:dermonecrotic toxin domain-containing protein n=1 Tax=Pseudomonas sp. RIT-PI-S TaxID=3035295 RepID=UPI0021D956E9|nr:DUF6543 domain-containing protein [Pseudomonas sp. RIT-PI-S]
MPVLPSLSIAVSDFSPLAGEAVKRFRDQPSLLLTASAMVAEALARLDPPVRLNPLDVALGWPAEVSPTGEVEYLILPELLIDLFVRDGVLTIVPGYQQALQWQNQRWVPLQLHLGRLAEELDALRPSLISAFKQELVQFWSEADTQGKTHWEWMGDYLRRAFVHALEVARLDRRIAPPVYLGGLTVAARGTSETTTEVLPGRRIDTCLLQAERGSAALPLDVRLDPYLLISLPLSEQVEGFMLFSPRTGLRYFESTQALLTALNTVFDKHSPQSVYIRRVKVEGDVFDALARTLLQTQLIQVTTLSERLQSAGDGLALERLKAATEALTGFYALDTQIATRARGWLQRSLPLWLRRAPAADRWHFAGALAQIAITRNQTPHRWFLEDIPTLETYALTRLREEAARAHPDGPALMPENIEASLEYVVQDLIAITGGPWEPQFREDPVSITDLAIDNLAAHSHGWLKVKAKPGTTLPSWLDGTELKALVRQINVGATYPALLREHLVEGPEVAERSASFCDQVATQLPLLAWELLMRGAYGMDRHGYHLVEAGVGARPVEDTTRLMSLGITAGAAYGVDTIAATYVFTRPDKTAGPCVLYRPMHTEQLRQYGSLDELWEDLAAPGDLQDEALLWMTDLGRTRYSHGGWRAPRVARFGQGDEFAPLEQPQPARPVLTPLVGPVLPTLYREVVTALVDMAERRTVSNAEDRWVSLGTLAWTLFNGLLPVFSGPLATAGWLIQLSDQFGDYLQVSEQTGTTAQDARNSLLFSVVMLLMSESFHWPLDEQGGHAIESEGEVEPGEIAAGPGVNGPLATGESAVPALGVGTNDLPRLSEEPVDEQAAMRRPQDFNLAWANAALALEPRQVAALAALRAEPPLRELSPIPHGPTQGLYLHDNRLLWSWQGQFFAVNFAEGEPKIIGPQGEPGPYLRRDEVGRWALDLRLRLRGGGPKSRIEVRRRQNQRDREQAERIYAQAIPAFDALRDRANPLAEVVDAAARADQPQIERRAEFDRILREGYEQCAELIDRYKALHGSSPLPNFPERICELSARLMHLSKVITDNLSTLIREYLDESPYLGTGEAALHQAVAEDIQRWQAFLLHFETLTEHAVTYLQKHQQTIEVINAFPGLGARTLEANRNSVETFNSVLQLWSSLVYCRLGLMLEPLRETPALAEQVHSVLEPVLVHSASHADSVENTALTPEERTRVFDTAIDHYQRGEDALRMFAQTLTPEQQSPAMRRLEEVIAALRKDAEQRMGELIRSTAAEPARSTQAGRRTGQPRPRPATRPGGSRGGARRPDGGPGPSEQPATEGRGELQVIRTADGGSVLAHVRTDPQTKMMIAEVVSNGRVLASWRQDATTGLWSKPAREPLRPSPESNLRLNTLVREADQALRTARREESQINRFKQATRVPADIEDQYHLRAASLEALAERVELALTRMNLTDAVTEEHGSAEVKARELRTQASTARRIGTEARIELSKSMMPTAGRVKFLFDAGEVSIRRIGRRAPIGRQGRRDFIQEYEIVDRQQHPLWYAHFHYDTASAAPEHYTVAHLKTVTQRFDGYQRQLQQARNDQEVVGIYRSRIDPVLARQLFLSLP